MSVCSNVTEQDLNNLRRLTEQQKNRRAIKIENRILKQTHDIKSAESLSPITKKIEEEINKSTQKVNEIIKKNNTPPLVIDNTPTTHQPIENNEGVIYDVELENTLSNMKKNFGFFNIEETVDGEVFWNGFSVEKVVGNKLEINEKI